MKILILGGTKFLGRALVDAALERGHEVTLFNRGQTNPDLYPEVKRIQGDRDGGLDALDGGSWDAVIDTCGYVPRLVKNSAEKLADKLKHYTFISTISVYSVVGDENRDESTEVLTIEDETTEEITGETYGPLKVLSEQAAEEAMPGRVLVIRPGLIVGPHDPTNRFTYWVTRVAEGGDVLAPDNPERPVQIIDVRDLAEWNIRMVEQNQTGIYNSTGPGTRLTIGDMLATIKDTTGSNANFIWVGEEILKENEVTPFTELPLWLPSEAGNGMMTINVQKALDAGMTIRPLAETVRATLDWHKSLDGEMPEPIGLAGIAGMQPEREAKLLKEWQARA